MERDVKKEFKSFKDRYKVENVSISFEEFDKYFYAEEYFYAALKPYTDDRFYYVLFTIISNILGSRTQELEYYVNLKPRTPIMQIEAETLQKDFNKLEKIYFEMYILYKKNHKIDLTHESSTKKTVEYLEENFPKVKELISIFTTLQDKFIETTEKHLKKIENKEDKKYESSVFN